MQISRVSIDRLGMVGRFLAARARARIGLLPPPRPLDGWNALFSRDAARTLAREKRTLEGFDLGLYQALNDPRLHGQIVFEYGVLVNALASFRGLRVLDVGTGRSTLPHWMVAQGATVTCLEHAHPVERRMGGALGRLNQLFLRGSEGGLSQVAASMLDLPFGDRSFNLVTSLSVIEHLDTDLPSRAYVPYDEQKRRAARTLDEMVRVTRPGGHLYITSDCVDLARSPDDAWRDGYYFRDGPPVSGAWAIDDVPALFYRYLEAHGCSLVGPLGFDRALLDRSPEHATYRGRYFSAFSVLVRRDAP